MDAIMKAAVILSIFCAIFLVGAARTTSNGATVSVSTSKEEVADLHSLWIAVTISKGVRARWPEDDASRRFSDIVAKSVRNRGFRGEIGILQPRNSTPGRATLLVLHLTNWEVKEGVAYCTFTASLRAIDGDRDLGQFSSSRVISAADGEPRARSDALVKSAQEAVNDLLKRIH